MDATTTICHRFTPHDQLCALTKSADILISATGKEILCIESLSTLIFNSIFIFEHRCSGTHKIQHG